MRILKGHDDRVVISCPADVSIWRPLAESGYPVYSQELILTGVLKLKASVSSFRVCCVSSAVCAPLLDHLGRNAASTTSPEQPIQPRAQVDDDNINHQRCSPPLIATLRNMHDWGSALNVLDLNTFGTGFRPLWIT